MSKRFENWHDAHEYAQAKANSFGLSVGIRKSVEFGEVGFNVRCLPKKEFRCGSDELCEAVEPVAV